MFLFFSFFAFLCKDIISREYTHIEILQYFFSETIGGKMQGRMCEREREREERREKRERESVCDGEYVISFL